MKLLFVITGIGLGHSIREAAIINEIKNIQPETEIIIAGYKNSYKYFQGKFPVIKIHGHKFPESSFAVSRLKSLLINLPYPIWAWLDKKKLVKLIKDFNPDKVIVDVQPVGIDAALACKKPCIAIYNLDLDEWRDFTNHLSLFNKIESEIMMHYVERSYQKADKVIIPTMHRPKKSEKYSLIHPIIRLMPSQLPQQPILMKKLGFKKPPIVVMLGGSKFGFCIAEKLITIAENFNEEFIIFGYNDLKTKNITSFKFKENFLEYLKVSKAAILLSGHTALSEVIVYKKPALVFPFKNYIEHYINIEQLKDYILAKYIDKNVSEEQLTSYIKELLKESPGLIKNMHKLDIVKNGAKEAAGIILKG